MAFVIFDPETTIIRRNLGAKYSSCPVEDYATEGAAKAAITRHLKKHPEAKGLDKLQIMDRASFHANIEKTRVVYSIMDRNHEKPITLPVNTPPCCDPSTELYWAM